MHIYIHTEGLSLAHGSHLINCGHLHTSQHTKPNSFFWIKPTSSRLFAIGKLAAVPTLDPIVIFLKMKGIF